MRKRASTSDYVSCSSFGNSRVHRCSPIHPWRGTKQWNALSEHSALRISDLLASPLSITAVTEGTLQIDLTISAHVLANGACKLCIEVQNTTTLTSGVEAKRDEALPSSFRLRSPPAVGHYRRRVCLAVGPC